MAAARAGDPEAIARLMGRVRPAVLGYSRAWLRRGAGDPTVADELGRRGAGGDSGARSP